MSEVIEPLMDHAEAERITERIRLTVDTTARNLDKLAKLVAEAFERRADLAMGYGSWAEYSQEEFGEETQTLAPQFRRQLVGMLSAEGMSTRAIAPAVGVSQRTAARDAQVSHDGSPDVGNDFPPAPEPDVDPEIPVAISPVSAPSAATPEAAPEPAPVRKVTGLDGKQYTAPKPNPQQDNKPKRRPLTDQFREATLNITRDCNRLERLTTDDRFNKNTEQISISNKSDLLRAIDALQNVANNL